MSIISSFLSVVKQNSMNYRDKEVDKPLLFRDCVIKDVACFQYSTLRKHVKFEHCTFNEDVVWGNEKERETSSRAEQDIVFHDCTFRKRVLMDGIECGGGIYFKDCRFEYESNDEEDYSLSISGAYVKIGIELDTCILKGGISLNGSTIEKVGCQLKNVEIENEKCEINMVATNMAKDFSCKGCNVLCKNFCANCLNVAHIIIDSPLVFDFYFDEPIDLVFLQKIFKVKGFPNVSKFTHLTPTLIYIETESGSYWGVEENYCLKIIRPYKFEAVENIDFSYSKIADKIIVENSILISRHLDFSNIQGRELILKNILYHPFFAQNTDNHIDISRANFNKVLALDNFIIKCEPKDDSNIYINLQSSVVDDLFYCSCIRTIDGKSNIYMESMKVSKWTAIHEDKNSKFDVSCVCLMHFSYGGVETDRILEYDGYDHMLSYVTDNSQAHFQKVCENILRLDTESRTKADEIRRKRINNLLEAKYSGAMLSIIKVIYRLTDYGLSNKSLISHACLAIICMGIINICFSVNHFDASSLSWENTFLVLKAFLQSFIDFFPMIDTATDGDSVIILGKIDNKAIYNCILFPYKVYGFFLISILIASISGVFQPRND